MSELLRHYFYYTFHSMSKYDYMAIGWILFLSLLLILLGIFVRKRSISFSLLFIGLALFFAGPPIIKFFLDNYLRSAEVSITSAKTLSYSHAAAVEGIIKNSGKLDFSHCDLVLIFHAPAHNGLSAVKSFMNPYAVHIEKLGFHLPKGEKRSFSILIDGYDKTPFKLTSLARCYP
ncbi:DUF2393 family protein [Hydrogenimonas sp.]